MPKTTPVEPKKIQLTAQGLLDRKAELEDLVNNKLPEIIKRVANARAHGDLAENAEYHNAREEQQLIQSRIEELEEVINHAQVVKNTKSSSKVGMGSTVVVQLVGKKGKTFTYHIVGEFEADPNEGRVSIDSPLGSALLGMKKDDKVVVKAPAGEISYLILDIK
jgi:transcription elongation factor GreA